MELGTGLQADQEIGSLVRILSGKHEGIVGNVKGVDEFNVLVDLGGGKLKYFKKSGVSEVRSFWKWRHPSAVESW